MAAWFLVFSIALGIFAIARTPVAAEFAAGTIKICRASAFGDLHHGRFIQIPVGAVFGDTGQVNDRGYGGRYWPLWIKTTEAATIDAAALCSNAQARITSDLEHHRVRVDDRRLFVQASIGQGGPKGWPGDLNLTATATADFE
ncbi:MAG: hypothetical protein HY058_20930 [Proteobacteria bacterium]|nr:hypothetical protein [Pseudomonadota bacterium]